MRLARPENEPKTPLAARLREVRRQIGNPVRGALVDTLGVSVTAISRYEQGDAEPQASVLAAYASAFGVNLYWLITGEGEMFTDPSRHPAAAPVPTIDPGLFRAVGRLVLKIYKEEGVKLPPDALLDEQAAAYNALITRAEDPRDTAELTALLPWLEARLRKALKAAVAEPGAGKRQA